MQIIQWELTILKYFGIPLKPIYFLIQGGTWEHKARKAEMDKTAREALQLTEAATGRHHIGDFLPPEELTKFMAKVTLTMIWILRLKESLIFCFSML